MLPGHPPPSAVNVFFYAQQNPIIRVKTATPCQKSVVVADVTLLKVSMTGFCCVATHRLDSPLGLS